MDSEKVTVVIPTYNRPVSLERILSYHHSHGFSGKIVVADSSSHHNLEKNTETISNLNRNIIHKTFSADVPVKKKIANVLRDIRTDYAVLNGDDDFIQPNGIKTTIKFLEQNDSFSAAHGNYVSFSAKETKSGVQFDWSPRYAGSRTLSQPRPRNRLHAHHSDYTPTFYAVHRTSSIQEGFERAVTATDDVRFGELLPSMTAVINGKFKHLNVFYGARYSAQQTGSTADNFIDFIQAGTFTSKHDHYRDSLAGHLQARSKLTYDESLKTVDDAMISYLIKSYGLTQEEATSLVKENKTPQNIMNSSSHNSVESISFPAKIRDWLQTTPAPERAISTLEGVYRAKNRYQNRDIERTKFYLQLDKPIIGNREMLKKIRQSVQSHPKALDE